MTSLIDATRLRGQVSEAAIDLRRLQSRLQAVETNCVHNHDASAWDGPTRSQETYKEAVVDHAATEYHGSDVFHHTKLVDATRPVFTRVCRFCGKVETTTKTKPSVTAVPAF